MPATSVSWNCTRRRSRYSLKGMSSCEVGGQGPPWTRLRGPNSHVLAEEEARQQHVDPEQSLARQCHRLLARFFQVAFFGERRELVSESVQDVDRVLVPEVGRPYASELQLQHELPNQPFLGARPIRAAQRDVARPTASPYAL